MSGLPEMIDLSLVRPIGTCVDFQQASLQSIGKKYSQGGLSFFSGLSGDLSIVQFPAPANAHPWVPPMVKYLSVSEDAWLEIQFPSPAAWVKVSVAKIAKDEDDIAWLQSIYLWVKNAKGWTSNFQTAPNSDPFGLVRSYEFSQSEKVVPPHGEFEPPLPLSDLGPITSAVVSSRAFLLWRVCYF